MSRDATRWMMRAVLVLGGAYAAFVVAINACASAPLCVEPLERRSGEPVVDGALDLARRYAPWVYHEVDPRGGRQDLPAPVDFDGNLCGDDNWENLAVCELVPTLAYAHLESATHHFLTYHVFHPRDWATVELGIHTTHEGDGENLQVVVDKGTGEVVLLFTQAHYTGRVHGRGDGAFESGEERLRPTLLLVDDEGRPDPRGAHAAVFVEARGHGIYSSADPAGRVQIDATGGARFRSKGLVLRPARPPERASEPSLDAPAPVPYQLESTLAKLWPGVRSGALVGPGRLFDVPVHYADERVSVELPKFHRGERFSGPFGPSRGISPFAVDFSWSAGTLGALFFDPARRYAQTLRVPSLWSLDYVRYPFAGR